MSVLRLPKRPSPDELELICALAEGDTIVVAGTQNANGFTAFEKETIASWMAREKTDFEMVLQIPLPSFAGKDEALFAFQRKAATTA